MTLSVVMSFPCAFSITYESYTACETVTLVRIEQQLIAVNSSSCDDHEEPELPNMQNASFRFSEAGAKFFI